MPTKHTQPPKRTLLTIARFARLMNIERRTATMLVRNGVICKGKGLVMVAGRGKRIDPNEFERAFPTPGSRRARLKHQIFLAQE